MHTNPTLPQLTQLAKHNNFGYAIRSLIENYGINQKEAAEIVGVSPSEMSNIIIRNQRSPLKVSSIIQCLPRSEMDRAFLQKALAIETVRNHNEPSPYLHIDTDEISVNSAVISLKRILEGDPQKVSIIKRVLEELTNPTSPHWKMIGSISDFIEHAVNYGQRDLLKRKYPHPPPEDSSEG